MPGKSVPLSVRVSDDDAAFLARQEIDGATTPSEKLRAMLRVYRARIEGGGDDAASMYREGLRAAQKRIRSAEREEGLRSDLILKLYERLPEIMALLEAGVDEDADRSQLQSFEAELADQVFAIIEEILELGLVSRNRCYDPQAVTTRLGTVFELVSLLELSQQRKKEGADE